MKQVDFAGTVSEATMRPQDVLLACMEVLAEYHPARHKDIILAITGKDNIDDARNTYEDMRLDCNHEIWLYGALDYVLNEDIFNAMNDIAPVGYYFGAHVGDGADYGYWPLDHLYDGG